MISHGVARTRAASLPRNEMANFSLTCNVDSPDTPNGIADIRSHGILVGSFRSFNLHRALSAGLALMLFLVPLFADGESGEDQATGAEIVQKYVSNLEAQQQNLRGVEMEVEISADLPKLHKTGKMNALRMISN